MEKLMKGLPYIIILCCVIFLACIITKTKERTAALMTDAIRGCLLESVGYKTALLEFVDMAHSPKNILIRAYKSNTPEDKRKAALQEALNLMEEFHLSPTLHKLLYWKKIGLK